MDFSTGEMRAIWVVGALERLGGFGYFNEIGFRVPDVDLFLKIDGIREFLFSSKEDFLYCVLAVLEGSCFSDTELEEIFELMIDYKENREKVIRYAMENYVC